MIEKQELYVVTMKYSQALRLAEICNKSVNLNNQLRLGFGHKELYKSNAEGRKLAENLKNKQIKIALPILNQHLKIH